MDDEKLFLWEELRCKQDDLFRDTANENVTLSDEVKLLQREVSVWKDGYDKKDKEKEELQQKVESLQRMILSLQEENQMVVCLIDGDGTIFSEELVTRGKEGGHDAATQLHTAIKEFIQGSPNGPSSRISSPTILCTIYINKQGLANTLVSNRVCDVHTFTEFFNGFNKATPLFTLVDVGNGKEAADAKLREHLKLYARLLQTRRVIFGGSHDNGYVSTLNALATEGLLDKLVILTDYPKIAYEIEIFINQYSVQLFSAPGLFFSKRLPHTPFTSDTPNEEVVRPMRGYSPPPSAAIPPTPSKNKKKGKPPNSNKPPFPPKTGLPSSSSPARVMSPTLSSSREPLSPSLTSTSMPSGKSINPSKPINNQNPPICAFFYLGGPGGCKNAENCVRSHNYALTPNQLVQFRQELAVIPCPNLFKHPICYYKDKKCLWSHKCPNGVPCSRLSANRPCFFEHAMGQNATTSA